MQRDATDHLPPDTHPALRTAARAAFFHTLLSRRSGWPLADPAPSDAELDLVFDAALRAPDHGDLRPWRFAVVRGDARQALGDVFVQAALARGEAPDDAERFRRKALSAPLLVGLGVHVVEGHRKVPVEEQLMTVAAGAMNMLNALHALGYGGFWSTGANGHDPQVAAALGFAAPDRLLGFLYVGTAQKASTSAPRPDRSAHVGEWTGRLDGR